MHRAACGRASLCGGVRRGCVGERKCSARACRCAGASEGLRWGRCCEGGGACIAQPAGVHRGCVGERKCSGRACRCAGREEVFGGEWVVRSAGNASRSLRACVGAAWRSGTARAGRVAVRGRATVFGGEWVVRSVGLTHIRRSRSRVRVLLYIRPPRHRREIAAMGSKRRSRECSSPAKTSAPAPSAFALPRPRSHFRARVHTSPHSLPRPPQSNRHPAATVIHNGLSTEKLSTSLPAALCKTFSPSRLRTRIYNISFARRPLPGSVRAAPEKSPRRCGTVFRVAVRRVGEGKAKADAPSRSAEPCRLCAESLCAKAECTRPTPPLPVRSPRGNLSTAAPPPACVPNHCAQRRKCTRPTPPLPVRSPRGNLSTAAPLPAYGRTAVCKGGSAQGKPRPCPCALPAATCLRPRPRPLMGEAPSAGWGRAKAKADAPSHSNPPQPVRSPRGSLSTAAPPPPKWAPRLRRREGKRPNGAPPHHNAHTPNAARKRYLHNSRTKTQRRTKRCAQFVFFVFTPCKLLHNFSTVLHRSPRNVPKRAQMAARRPDFPCFTARFSPLSPESHRAKHPRTAPVLPPKNAPLRAYAKPRSYSRVRGTRQHATTCAFFTFSARYERIGGT